MRGKKLWFGLGFGGRAGRYQHHRIAQADDDGAACLFGDLAGFKRQLLAVEIDFKCMYVHRFRCQMPGYVPWTSLSPLQRHIMRAERTKLRGEWTGGMAHVRINRNYDGVSRPHICGLPCRTVPVKFHCFEYGP